MTFHALLPHPSPPLPYRKIFSASRLKSEKEGGTWWGRGVVYIVITTIK